MNTLTDYTNAKIAAAEAGPHKGWNTFDTQNEGVRIHALHSLVSNERFDDGAAKAVLAELSSLAQSYGYATCDGILAELGTRQRDDVTLDATIQIRFDALFHQPDDDYYFHEITKSEATLWAAAATQQARDFLKGDHISFTGTHGLLYSTVMGAFERGRDMMALNAGREDMVAQNSPARAI